MNINMEMTELERQHNCINTIINMLKARNWLNDDYVFDFKDESVNEIIIKCLNKIVVIKFYNIKLTTFKNDKEIDLFINKFIDYHKILVVTDIIIKLEKLIFDTKHFEVFKIMDIIKDISLHHLVPKHRLLSTDDANKVMTEYKIKKKDMGRIYIDDPMARYLYAQCDDVIQIIRYSIVAGYSTYYRMVIPSLMDK